MTNLDKNILVVLDKYKDALAMNNGNVVGNHDSVLALIQIKKYLQNNFCGENNGMIAECGYGQGAFTMTPWVAIFDKRITKRATEGVYPVFLFKADMTGFYLSMSKAVGQNGGKPTRSRLIELRTESEVISSRFFLSINDKGFKNTPPIDLCLGDRQGQGIGFEAGSIVHKKYEKEMLRAGSYNLEDDLELILKAYDDYCSENDNESSQVFSEDFDEAESISLSDVASLFYEHLKETGAALESDLVVRFFASLLSKRFLILTGKAGSGKTQLAVAFARWITRESTLLNNSSLKYVLLPVGADWTGNENILGYPDGLHAMQYVAKPALDLIFEAADCINCPHFLILDEMNLSHVERYFADILSIIESGQGLELYSGDMQSPETWRKTLAGKPIPPKLKQLPDNLFIIGTVNVDETTYMFSPKVLDRANVIEFIIDARGLESFLGNSTKPDLNKLDGKGELFGKTFVDSSKNPAAVPDDVRSDYNSEMLLFFQTLQTHGAEFGYRTAYETSRFIHFYKLLGNHTSPDIKWFLSAFDCVIFQKLLPKLHGSRAKLGPVLKKLWFLCVKDMTTRGADALKTAEAASRSTDKNAEPSVIVPTGAPYPLSAEKIGRMWRLLNENGFTSFAEA